MGTTTKVRLHTSRVLSSGRTQEFGEVVEMDQDEAARLVATGQAFPVLTGHETAAVVPPERRAKGAK